GLQERDLVVGEWSSLGARNKDRSDGNAIPQHWYEETAAKANRACQVMSPILWIKLDIRNVDHVAVEDRPANPQAAARTGGGYAMHGGAGLGGGVVCGDGAS